MCKRPFQMKSLHSFLHLKITKSSGPDKIRVRLLKENANLLSEPLYYIFNLSLISGVVPEKFKLAEVVPIYKKVKPLKLKIIGLSLYLIYSIKFLKKLFPSVAYSNDSMSE